MKSEVKRFTAQVKRTVIQTLTIDVLAANEAAAKPMIEEQALPSMANYESCSVEIIEIKETEKPV